MPRGCGVTWTGTQQPQAATGRYEHALNAFSQFNITNGIYIYLYISKPSLKFACERELVVSYTFSTGAILYQQY